MKHDWEQTLVTEERQYETKDGLRYTNNVRVIHFKCKGCGQEFTRLRGSSYLLPPDDCPAETSGEPK